MTSPNVLPPKPSVYDYPVVFPGVELSVEQEEQFKLAQVAAVMLAVSQQRALIQSTAVFQVMSLLRATDLSSKVAVRAFAKQAALIVKAALVNVRLNTWGGVVERARVYGVSVPSVPPPLEKAPVGLRFSRGSDLVRAYERLGDEYRKWVSKDRDDPSLVASLRRFNLDVSSVTPTVDSTNFEVKETNNEEEKEQTWETFFQKAARKAESVKDTRPKSKKPESTQQKVSGATLPAGGKSSKPAGRSEAFSDSGNSANATINAGVDDTVQDFRRQLEELDDNAFGELIERWARQKTEERLERMVAQDVASAARNAHQEVLQKTPKKVVVGFRRVVHPELSKSGSCGLCIVASTMKYTRGDLLPIHAGCNCETVEIYNIDGRIIDPGQQINEEDLFVFYREAKGSTRGWDLKRWKYKIVDHPEYGPTLLNSSAKHATEHIEFQQKGTL